MRGILETEIRKAFSGKWFLIAFIFMIVLAIVSAVGNIVVADEYGSAGIAFIEHKYFPLALLSCFRYWIGIDYMQPSTGLFYLLAPIVAALPYAWSLSSERRSGLASQMLSRTKHRNYYIAKSVAVFLSSGTVVAVPLVINFLVCSCFLPLYVPDVFDVVYYGVYEDCMWSEVFYTAPIVYCVLLTTSSFVFAGLWANATSAISIIVRNRLTFTVVPFLILLVLEYLNVTVLSGFEVVAITPIEYLRGAGTPLVANGWVVLAEYLFLLILSSLAFFYLNKRDVL